MYQETQAGQESCSCENCVYNRGKGSLSVNLLCQAVEVIQCAQEAGEVPRTFLVFASQGDVTADGNKDGAETSVSKNRRKKRESVNEREKVHACHVCGKRFTRRDNLLVHQVTHSGVKPHECQICYKKFTRKGNLLTHMLTHSSERQYECQTCFKKFTTKDNLTRHMNTHYGVRSHVCGICSRAFAEKATLTKHMVTHTDEKLYECSVCLKRYKTKAILSRHMQSHEPEEMEP